MNRKFFWLGYFLALVALFWILWRQRRDEMEEILARVRESTPGSDEWLRGIRTPAPVASRLGREEASPATPQREAPQAPEADKKDDLEEIKGIGPVYARRLYDAGITQFSQLAALSVEEVSDRIQLESWRGNVSAWIEQARALTRN